MTLTSRIIKEIRKATIGASLEEQIIQDHPGLFAAMVIDENETFYIFKKIRVYLINNTDKKYPYVKLLSWGSCSVDDGLIETGKALSGPYALDAYSALQLPGSDTGELDFIIWHLLDMADENNGSYQYTFALPKYGLGPQPVSLPYLDPEDKGMKLPLSKRDGYSIEQLVAIKGLEPRDIVYTKEQLESIYGRSDR